MLLRCPQCKEVTTDRARTFPHCIRCGRLLAECRHCLHFDAQTQQCRSAHRDSPTRVNPDDLPTCGYYLSRLDPSNAPLRRVTRAALPWLALTLGLALLACVGLRLWPGAGQSGHEDQAAVLECAGSHDLQSDAVTTLCLNIRNTGSDTIREVRLDLGADLFGVCNLVSIKPAHQSHTFDRVQKMHSYCFGPLKPGKTLKVELDVQPRPEAGYSRVRWAARACGDGGVVLARTTNVAQIVP